MTTPEFAAFVKEELKRWEGYRRQLTGLPKAVRGHRAVGAMSKSEE